MKGKMNAVVLRDFVRDWEREHLTVEEVPIPKTGPKEALVKVKACGVGLTVSHFLEGRIVSDPQILPRIPGHEIAGDVVEIGESVDEIVVGDRVLAYFYLTCGACKFCLVGRSSLCLNLRGYVGIHLDGGYAEYVKLPASNLIKFPSAISYKDATVVNDALATPVHIMSQRANLKPGDDMMIIGAGGGVGIHLVQLARYYGMNVIGVDVDDAKLKMTKEVGANAVINSAKTSITDEVRRITGGKGVEAAVDFVVTDETIRDSYQSISKAGRMILMNGNASAIPLLTRVPEEIEITGSRYASKLEFMRAIEHVRKGVIRPIISKETTLEKVEEVHRLLHERKLLGRAVMIFE